MIQKQIQSWASPRGPFRPQLRLAAAGVLAAMLSCGAFAPLAQAASGPGKVDGAAAPGTTAPELKALIDKVQSKLQSGKNTEADFAAEFKEFDTLLAKNKGKKTDDVAQILSMKAKLYLRLDNLDKGVASLQQLKQDFPGTKPADDADKVIASAQKQAEAKKIQASLVEGTAFPDFQEQDLAGKPLSVANYKGKVVLIDFWATWCGPCVGELPNVQKTYEKYHSKGFEIIGISLDSDRDKLTSFIGTKKMPWVQYFDGNGWGNKLAKKYGVNSIPATYLLDGQGKIIAKNLRGEALASAVFKALNTK